ncbi:MAG: IS200/IS605 family accessory protein TnpB-related protein [Candidatus Methanomethylicaceae archaeon]
MGARRKWCQCHPLVSKRIVSFALATNSYILLGGLTGIRKKCRRAKKKKGKRRNRIVSNMPNYRLTKMIEYKAMLKGIPVIITSEAYTSRYCHIYVGAKAKEKLKDCLSVHTAGNMQT